MKICVIVLFCNLFFASCFITKTKNTLPLTDSFAKEEALYDYENELFDTDQLIKREDSNDVSIKFFGEINDTLVLKINGKEQIRWTIFTKNYPATSSDFSGIGHSIAMGDWIKDIRIELLRKKVYIPLRVNTNYPLYVLYRINKRWHISGRRKLLIIK